MRAPTTQKVHLRSIRPPSWVTTLSLGSAAGLGAFFAIWLAALLFTVLYDVTGNPAPSPEAQRLAQRIITAWVVPAIFFLLTLLASFGAARLARTRPLLHASLGSAASFSSMTLAIYLSTPDITWSDTYRFFLLGALATALAALRARRRLTDEQLLGHIGRAIGNAGDPEAVCEAIGRGLRGTGVSSVLLWRVPRPASAEFGYPAQTPVAGPHSDPLPHLSYDPWAAWSSSTSARYAQDNPFSTTFRPGPALIRRLHERPICFVSVDDLPDELATAWAKANLTTGYLCRLAAPRGELVGLMAVAAEGKTAPHVGSSNLQEIARHAALTLAYLTLTQGGVLTERQRLARELHDGPAQGLLSIVTLLRVASERLTSDSTQHLDPQPVSALAIKESLDETSVNTEPPSHTDRTRKRAGKSAALTEDQGQEVTNLIDHALQTASDSLNGMRRFLWALRPEELERDPLPNAIKRLAHRRLPNATFHVTFAISGTPFPITPEAEEALLRVAQEALANAAKHSSASRVTITLSYMHGLVILDVNDDGIGFDQDPLNPLASASPSPVGGIGLLGARERLAGLGGRLVVESTSGEGTTLVAEIPQPLTPATPDSRS